MVIRPRLLSVSGPALRDAEILDLEMNPGLNTGNGFFDWSLTLPAGLP
jgi:hypothetical protein